MAWTRRGSNLRKRTLLGAEVARVHEFPRSTCECLADHAFYMPCLRRMRRYSCVGVDANVWAGKAPAHLFFDRTAQFFVHPIRTTGSVLLLRRVFLLELQQPSRDLQLRLLTTPHFVSHEVAFEFHQFAGHGQVGVVAGAVPQQHRHLVQQRMQFLRRHVLRHPRALRPTSSNRVARCGSRLLRSTQ